MKATMARFLPAVLVSVVAGCAAPVITVHHILPAALPLDGQDWQFQATSFVASSVSPAGAIAQEDAADLLVAEFARRQTAQSGQVGHPAREGRTAWVAGKFDLTVTDRAGHRTVRLRNPQSGQLEPHELPTLVRKAMLRVDFQVRSDPDGPAIGTAEVRREYNSAVDPNVLGPLGLERSDDPQRIPAVRGILRSLSAHCVGEFFDMVRPLKIAAEVALQPASDADSRAGLRAVEENRYADAVVRFEKALAANPGDLNARFNLAASAEAAGDLAKARDNYAAVLKAADTKHPLRQPAADGLARVERVLLSRAARHMTQTRAKTPTTSSRQIRPFPAQLQPQIAAPTGPRPGLLERPTRRSRRQGLAEASIECRRVVPSS